jgi:hypothetical protein
MSAMLKRRGIAPFMLMIVILLVIFPGWPVFGKDQD